MALNLNGFVTEEQSWGGLGKLTQNLENKKLRDERQQEQDNAKRNAMSKFLEGYADPKEHLSGSPLDPQVTKGFLEILSDGARLINENKGLSTDMLMMALAPKVNRLSEYSSKAKVINDGIKQRLATVSDTSGYDKFKLSEAAKKQAFYNPDGSLKDIYTIDPDEDYVAGAVKSNPADVTNNKGLDEWFRNQRNNINSHTVTRWGSRGQKESQKVKITAPPWAIPETDDLGVSTGKFVPMYQKATEGGEALMHDFIDETGKKTKAQVRLLDDGLFDSIMGNSSGTADWIKGQVMTHLKEFKNANGQEIDINSPQARNVARGLLYDELKRRNPGSMEDVVESKPIQIKQYAPKQVSKSDQNEAEAIADLHKSLDDQELDEKGEIPVTSYLTGIQMRDKFGVVDILPDVKFNPSTRTFTTINTKGDSETIPYHTFVSRVKTANPNIDMKFLKGFNTYKRGEYGQPIPEEKQAAPEKTSFLKGLKNIVQKGIGAKPSKGKLY